MGKMLRGALIFSSTLICGGILAGCSVALKNHTASEFPWTYANRRPLSETLYAGATPQEIVAASVDFKHKFLLEIKPDKQVSNVKAFVTVNGHEHRMDEFEDESGKGLFVYQPVTADCDHDKYDYFYRVGYHAGIIGSKTKYLREEDGSPFHAVVLGSGSYVWWSRYHLPDTGNGDIHLRATTTGGGKRDRFFIQSLSSSPIRIASIGLSSGGDATKFTLEKLPSSRELACQDYLAFDLVWTPTPPDFVDSVSVVFQVEFDRGGGEWMAATSPVTVNITTGPAGPPV